MPTCSPIKYHGGKTYLAKRIIELMPPHVHYVEPYFGGGSVLLQKPFEGVSEVANDLNWELTNFWTVLKREDLFEQFVRAVEAHPFSNVAFAQSTWFNEPREPQRQVPWAVNFFIRMRQSRQGLGKDFATLSHNRTRRGMNEQVSSWLTAIEGLPEVHSRLKRVVILNDDAVKVIRQQDGPNTVFYCDPPYLHETRVTKSDYQHEMDDGQHEALLMCLASIKGNFLLSGYRSQLYDRHEMRFGWNRHDFEIDNKASSKAVKEIKTECVWCNF